jgi:uncharacterized membrane protein
MASQTDLFNLVAHWTGRGIEAAGISIIVVGGLIATVAFLLEIGRKAGFSSAYHRYRGNLGRAILLGLEFLVAGDIIGTVAVDPTFRSLGVLALIVAIRTFLSFTLEVEVNGRWPWQEARQAGSRAEDQRAL